MFCLFGFGSIASATESRSPADTSTFTFMFENDLFGNMDEQYTNGIQIGWLSKDLAHYSQASRVPGFLLDFASYLPFILRTGFQVA